MITQHPMMQAQSNGMTRGTAIALVRGTTQYSANPPMCMSWCTGRPAKVSRVAPSSIAPRARVRVTVSQWICSPLLQ